MTLYLCRHGAVEDVYRGRYNGHLDIPASKAGLIEAKENFKALSDIDFDVVYCSTLQRAKATLDVLGVKQKIIYTEVLREKSWGRHEGKSYEEVVQMEARTYENFEQWLEVLDGQDHQKFIENIRQFLLSLAQNSYKNVLLMTHAGVIYSMIHLIDTIPLEEAFSINISYGNFYKISLNHQNHV